MKKNAVILILCCMVSLVHATVLFSDSFDRPNNVDIDASSIGMSGALSPMTYVESFEGSGVNTSIQIVSNRLNVAFGPNMSNLYLDHNFTDSAIRASGGFSVTLDVVSISSTTTELANRYGGFGVGMTQAEAAAAGDIGTSPTTMRGGGTATAVADFFVDTALDNNLHIYSKGVLLNTISVGSYVGTIKVEFFLSDFNAGSLVTAVVYFNGVQRDVRTFTWDHTGANYIGISGRTPANGVVLDNLQIATYYDVTANSPAPAHNSQNVEPGTLVLQWHKGKDTAGNPNANIARHYLYIVENEPNFVGISPITVPDSADPIIYDPVDAMDMDKTFYWRVDESVLVGGTPTVPADGNTITGFVWKFETTKSIPVIQSQPVNQLVGPGQTAVFAVSVTSVSPDLHYQWYKSADNANTTGGDDTPVGTDADILAISNAQIGDEGYYFCAATNPAATVNSDVVILEIKRLIAWYAFENNLTDSENDYDGTPIKADVNLPFSYDDHKVNQAITLNGVNEAVQVPCSIRKSMTIELWVKTTDTGASGTQWYAGKGLVDGDISNAANDFGLTLLNGGRFSFGIGNPDTTIISTSNINDGQWHYCVATRDHMTGQIQVYVDGSMEASGTASPATLDAPSVLRIGSIQTAVRYLNGRFDEVKLSNYPLTELEVASRYTDIENKPACISSQRPDARYDVNGDCIVNLEDFVVLVLDWLNCGLYPQSECQ